MSNPIEQYEERIRSLEERVLELEQKVFLKLDDSTIRSMHHPHCFLEPNLEYQSVEFESKKK